MMMIVKRDRFASCYVHSTLVLFFFSTFNSYMYDFELGSSYDMEEKFFESPLQGTCQSKRYNTKRRRTKQGDHQDSISLQVDNFFWQISCIKS